MKKNAVSSSAEKSKRTLVCRPLAALKRDAAFFHGESQERNYFSENPVLDLRNYNLLFPGIFAWRSGRSCIRQGLRNRGSSGLRLRRC